MREGMNRDHLRHFANLFVSRRDDYAIQQADGRYLRAGRPLTYSALVQHLQGNETIGTYVIDEGDLCRFALFDDDTEHDDLEERVKTLVGVQRRLREASIPSYLEGSRRGLTCGSSAHGWCLLPSCGTGCCPIALLVSSFIPSKMRAHESTARWCGCLWGCIAGPIAATGFSPGTRTGGSTWFPLFVVSLSR